MNFLPIKIFIFQQQGTPGGAGGQGGGAGWGEGALEGGGREVAEVGFTVCACVLICVYIFFLF